VWERPLFFSLLVTQFQVRTTVAGNGNVGIRRNPEQLARIIPAVLDTRVMWFAPGPVVPSRARAGAET